MIFIEWQNTQVTHSNEIDAPFGVQLMLENRKKLGSNPT